MDFLANWAIGTWQMVIEAAPWLIGGFALAGMVYVMVPVEKVVKHLGHSGLSAVLKASLLGLPLPLCSCSVIPIASSIRKQGASRGAFASFLISTPETGVDSLAISYAMLGPLLAIVRPIAAFVTAVVAGVLIGWSDGDGEAPATGVDQAPGDNKGEGGSCCCGNSSGSLEPDPPKRPGKFVIGLHHGLVTMVTDLSPYLVLGFLLAGLVGTAIPEGFLERNLGSGLPAMLLMLVVGLPLYVCATSSTPMAAALIFQGLSPGAALVFLLAGPATNIATMLVVHRETGRRGLVIYLSTIAVVAVGFGLAVDAFMPLLPDVLTEFPMEGHHHASFTTWPAAVALVLLIANGLRLRVSRGS